MDKNSKINVQNRSILCENWLKRCSLNIFQRAFLNDLAQKWSIMVENCPLSRIHFCKMGLFFPKNGQYSRPATMKKNKNDSKKRLFLSGNGWNKRIEVFCKQSACYGHSKHFDKDIILYKLPAEILLVFMLRL